jgi:hypothetical protein
LPKEDSVASTKNPTAPEKTAAAQEPATYWRETKVGTLLSMESEEHGTDPCPQIPEVFLNPQYVSKLVGEIGHSGATAAVDELGQAVPSVKKKPEPRPGLPKVRERTLIASLLSATPFALLLAAAAWKQGFHAAARRAFLADGSSTMWGIWRAYFSHYVPIVDFIHALSYVFAAAMAGVPGDEGWSAYVRWSQWLWSGEIKRIIEELETRQAAFGPIDPDAAENSPQGLVAACLTYLQNQQGRMKYAEYRCQGLPITTCHIESAVKQVGRRVKGTEKFWSTEGAEPILASRGAHLSDTQPMVEYWEQRQANATGQRQYATAA